MSGSTEPQNNEALSPTAIVGDTQFEIVFSTSPPVAYDLTFGEGGEDETEQSITGTVLVPFVKVYPRLLGFYSDTTFDGTLTLQVQNPTLSIKAFYDIDTFTGFSKTARQAFQAATRMLRPIQSLFYESLSEGTAVTTKFEEATHLKTFNIQKFEEGYTVSSYAVNFYQEAQPVKVYNLGDYQEALPLSTRMGSGFQNAKKTGTYYEDSFQEAIRMANRFGDSMQETELLGERYHFSTYYSAVFNTSFLSFFQNAEFPVNVVKVVVPPVIPEPSQSHDFDLTFECLPPELALLPQHYDIIFNNGCDRGQPPINVDFTEPYFVINTVELTNLETGEKLQALSIDFSTDTSSFAWSGSLTLPASEVLKVNSPTNQPVILSLEFNGNTALFLVQSISKAVSFNQKTYKVGLISPTALLDAPFSRVGSDTLKTNKAPQAILETLFNTPVTGVALDWQYLSPLDWIVKAQTFSYQSLSPIKAAGELLSGSAVFLYSELGSKTVTVRKKRPFQFWETALEPIELSESFTTSHSLSREYHPNYTAVYVISGVTGVSGTTAHITREGSSGSELAEQVVAPTLTSNAALIDAGKYKLGTAGLVEKRSLSMPVLPESPLLKPADVIKFTLDGDVCIGTVIGTSISVKFNSQYQNFEVEVVRGFN